MRRSIALVALIAIVGCAGPADQPSPPEHVSAPPAPIATTPEKGQAAGDGDKEDPMPQPMPTRGPITSREQAIGLFPAVSWAGNLDAVLVENFVPPAWKGQEEGKPRSTWIVQRLRPGPHETFYVDANTGEVYMVRQTEAPAPVTLPKSAQDGVDLVFQRRGDHAYLSHFPKTTGTEHGELEVTGASQGAKVPAAFTVNATPSERGEYDVTFTLQWRLNERDHHTTWLFKVYPDGFVDDAGMGGDEPPQIP